MICGSELIYAFKNARTCKKNNLGLSKRKYRKSINICQYEKY